MVRRICALVALCFLLPLCAGAQGNVIKNTVKMAGKSTSKSVTKVTNSTTRQMMRGLPGSPVGGAVGVGSRGINFSAATGSITTGKPPLAGQQGALRSVRGADVPKAVHGQPAKKATADQMRGKNKGTQDAEASPSREELLEKIPGQQQQYNLKTKEGQKLAFQTGIGKSVLFAPFESDPSRGFSVTIFKTGEPGREEIFGIIASHALPASNLTLSSSLRRTFNVKVKDSESHFHLLPAEVVQISPQSMLDISLVKFAPEDEFLLRPLELADTPAGPGEAMCSYGHIGLEEKLVARTVQTNSFISTRTENPFEGNQNGFCGSPLLDMSGRIKAIHSGYKDNVSYGTHVNHIRTLVEAYHNNGQAVYDVVIGEHTFLQLNVDEYIAMVFLYDHQGKRIFMHNFGDKFSEKVLLNALEDHPEAAYVQFTSRKAQWSNSQGVDILKEDRSKKDLTKRQNWYNLQTQEILPARPDIIKM